MLPSATRPPSACWSSDMRIVRELTLTRVHSKLSPPACYQGPGSKQIVERRSTENVRSLMIPLRFKHGIGKLIKLHTYLLQRPKTTLLTVGIKNIKIKRFWLKFGPRKWVPRYTVPLDISCIFRFPREARYIEGWLYWYSTTSNYNNV